MRKADRFVLIFVVSAMPFRAFAAPADAPGFTAEITAADRSFTVKSPRLSATVRDGVIISLKNLKTGEIHADGALGDLAMPTGLGHLGQDAAAAAKLHIPWGEQSLNQTLAPGAQFTMMHRPHPGSRYQTVKIDNGLRATWTGLTNGVAQFPEESLTVEFWVDRATGALLFKGAATSPQGGVYGLQIPMANLHPDHEWYIPSFGGIMYNKDMPPGLVTLADALFCEAPVVGIQGRKGSLGLWKQDEQFHPYFCFFNWSGKSFAFAFEHLNRMPFETLKSAESVAWRLDGFEGGWVDAMTPYQQWYARRFAPELRIRDSVKWADKIRIVIDQVASLEMYRALAAIFDPATVLIHEWNARAPSFDTELPDWTPRAHYPDMVAAIHQYGFKTMAYVNTYCINYNSPVFKRDKLKDVVLFRPIPCLYYDYLKPRQTLENAKEGLIYYTDPLSAKWRRYHTDTMIQWRQATGTDANYEDTAGCAGDFGNGIVDGLFGAQGSAAMFRELLQRNPSVPMASEFCSEAIAFGVRWPLRYQQVWGADGTRVFWMERMRPVAAYLFGPNQRPWIPTLNAESEFKRHVVVACSDALGGMAQFPATSLAELNAAAGVTLHMKWRAQVFSRRQLTPYFRRDRYEKNLACLYQDRDGGIYKYYTDPQTQTMFGPDEKPLYQRVTGQNQIATPLALPGWPAANSGRILGLDPAARYALMPGVPDTTSVRILSLPEGIKVRRFYDIKSCAVLALERVNETSPKQGTVVVQTQSPSGLGPFAHVRLNDQAVKTPEGLAHDGHSAPTSYETTFPAYWLFSRGGAETPAPGQYFGDGREHGHYVSCASGLDRGDDYIPHIRTGMEVPGEKEIVPFTFVSGGADSEVTLDYLVTVPSKDSTLKLYTIQRENRYGNGVVARLYLNGKLVQEKDFGPTANPDWREGMPPEKQSLWNNRFHVWRLPLGKLAGQPVLVTIASDAKGDNNSDNLYWSRPVFIPDPEQKELFAEVAPEQSNRTTP